MENSMNSTVVPQKNKYIITISSNNSTWGYKPTRIQRGTSLATFLIVSFVTWVGFLSVPNLFVLMSLNYRFQFFFFSLLFPPFFLPPLFLPFSLPTLNFMHNHSFSYSVYSDTKITRRMQFINQDKKRSQRNNFKNKTLFLPSSSPHTS